MSSAFSMMATMASKKGTINRISMTIVMAVTARPRFFHSRPSTFNMNGQVATTIMMAQMSDSKNGLIIQNVAAIRIPIQRTCRVIRVGSGAEILCIVILFFPKREFMGVGP